MSVPGGRSVLLSVISAVMACSMAVGSMAVAAGAATKGPPSPTVAPVRARARHRLPRGDVQADQCGGRLHSDRATLG